MLLDIAGRVLGREGTPSDVAGSKVLAMSSLIVTSVRDGKNRANWQERNECLPGGFNDCCQQRKMQSCPGRVLEVLIQTASEGKAAWEPLQAGLANMTIWEMITAGAVTGFPSPASLPESVARGKQHLGLSSATHTNIY